ncbi:MAG: ArsR/SmtB family transcription factor [Bacillaceae bacterium]
MSEQCEVYCFNEEKGMRLRDEIGTLGLDKVAILFKALGDETRLKIMYALFLEGELCVCDVANIIGSSVATSSHHLRFLQNSGLAKKRKEGKLVLYSLDDDHVNGLLALAIDHSKEVKQDER